MMQNTLLEVQAKLSAYIEQNNESYNQGERMTAIICLDCVKAVMGMEARNDLITKCLEENAQSIILADTNRLDGVRDA